MLRASCLTLEIMNLVVMRFLKKGSDSKVLSENSSKVLPLCGRQDLAFGTASQSADTFTQIRFHDWNHATSQ